MAQKTSARMGRADYILIGLMVVAPLTFIAAIPWLRSQSDGIVFLATGAASVIVLASSLILAIIKDRQVDEWSRTSARFSVHWGYIAGGSFLAFLLVLPPFKQFIVQTITQLNGSPVDDTLIIMTFTGGFLTCIIIQMIFIVVLGAIWRFRMSRAA